MLGAETLDHIAIPVRDLDRAEKFYLEAVGLKMLTQRKNADGSPRHTYALAGESIIGLNLPGIQTEPSPSGAPRYAVALSSEEAFHATVEKIKATGVAGGTIQEHPAGSFFVKSFRFVDPEANAIEICLRRDGGKEIYLSHVVFEATDLERALRFYTRALGLKPAGKEGGETLLMFPSRQLIGLKPVSGLSERTKKHGRAVHVALLPRDAGEESLS